MGEKTLLTGNEAIAHGVRVSKPDLVAVYPITPQTQIPEMLTAFSAQFHKTGLTKLTASAGFDGVVLNVESEHSAMAACYGAALSGARAFTATSSHGLLYMYEMAYWAAGARLPIVLANVCRALGSPWVLWADHNDSMSLRDFPAIHFFAGSCQEAHDLVPIAYRLAERTSFLTVLSSEGFVLSASGEPVELLDQAKVDLFLPKYEPRYRVDVNDPRAFGASSDTPDFFYELRRSAYRELDLVQDVMKEVSAEFKNLFGREYGAIETYLADDVDTILVTMGTTYDTAKIVVDEYRKLGKRLGLVKVRMLRPFPTRELLSFLRKSRPDYVIVIESNNVAAITHEIRSLMYPFDRDAKRVIYAGCPIITGCIAGIGGREIGPDTIAKIIEETTKKDVRGNIFWEGDNGK